MDYYKQKQLIAKVDKDDDILGRVDKWEAHKEGILHRGYTCILIYKNQFVFQHRKHPVFDKVFDLSFSSHQIYKNGTLQSDGDAIYEGLKREWNLGKKDLKSEPRFLKKIYYKAKDPKSEYSEHEIDHIYKVELNTLLSPDLNFAYGFKIISRNHFLTPNSNLLTTINLAPWVKKMLDEKLI